MARVKMKVTVEGIKELSERLENPRLVQMPFRELLTDAGRIGQRAAMSAIDGGTGAAVRSINLFINPTNARVTSAMKSKGRFKSIDLGRKPGERLSLRSIERWQEAVGHPGSAWEIRHEIGRRGTKGKQVRLAARNAVNAVLPKLRGEMEDKIEGAWKHR